MGQKNPLNNGKLKDKILSNLWLKEEVSGKIKIYWMKIKTVQQYQNLWDMAKAVVKGKFIVLSVCIRKQKKSPINHLSSHLKNLEKKRNKPKWSQRKEVIEINEIENKQVRKLIKQVDGSLKRSIQLTNLFQD